MSQQGEHIERGYLGTEDLTGKRYHFMKADTSAENKALLNNTSGGQVLGTLHEDPGDLSTTNEDVIIDVSGFIKVKLGNTVDEGDRIMSDGSAQGIKATATKYFAGIAMAAGVANDVIEVDANKNGFEPA